MFVCYFRSLLFTSSYISCLINEWKKIANIWVWTSRFSFVISLIFLRFSISQSASWFFARAIMHTMRLLCFENNMTCYYTFTEIRKNCLFSFWLQPATTINVGSPFCWSRIFVFCFCFDLRFDWCTTYDFNSDR